MSGEPVDPRLKTSRKHAQSAYDRETIDAILDDAILCHIGFVRNGSPVVIPTMHARFGDLLYIHGSSAGKMLREIVGGLQLCVTVTLLDGLVLARSAFEQNVNYRSVVLYGTATPIDDPTEKLEALQRLTNHLIPNRWNECRPPSRQELKATSIMSIPIEAASAKIRTGGPTENPDDLWIEQWAGEIPRHVTWGPPVPEPDLVGSPQVPASVLPYPRQGS